MGIPRLFTTARIYRQQERPVSGDLHDPVIRYAEEAEYPVPRIEPELPDDRPAGRVTPEVINNLAEE